MNVNISIIDSSRKHTSITGYKLVLFFTLYPFFFQFNNQSILKFQSNKVTTTNFEWFGEVDLMLTAFSVWCKLIDFRLGKSFIIITNYIQTFNGFHITTLQNPMFFVLNHDILTNLCRIQFFYASSFVLYFLKPYQ